MPGATQMSAAPSNMPTGITAPTGMSGGSTGMPTSKFSAQQNAYQVNLNTFKIYLLQTVYCI